MNEIELWQQQESILSHNKDLVEKLNQLASEIEAKSASIFDDLMTDTEDTKKNDAIFDYSRYMREWSEKVRQTSREVGKRAVITDESKIQEIINELTIILDRQKSFAEDINYDLTVFLDQLKNDLK